MARVFYSMAGEGRGHATRARTVIENLRQQGHSVTVYAPEFAYRMLTESYLTGDVTIRQIPGLMFHYNREKLSYIRTASGLIRYLAQLPDLVRQLIRDIQDEGCDAAITDFEPALPRAAAQAGVKWMSLDHQHFLVVSDFRDLTIADRLKTQLMGLGVRQYYNQPEKMVVSSFYFPPVKPQYRQQVEQCGVLLRRQIVDSTVEQGDHVVVYLRRFAPKNVIDALASLGRNVHIYGLGDQPSQGNLHFLPVTETAFLEDLRSCRALISNAGNQLVGEALYLEKAVFVFPEERNLEQQINARYLKASGGGDAASLRNVTGPMLNEFVERAGEFQCETPRSQLNGNTIAMNTVNQLVGQTAKQPLSPAAVAA